jgi:hypothetical protein
VLPAAIRVFFSLNFIIAIFTNGDYLNSNEWPYGLKGTPKPATKAWAAREHNAVFPKFVSESDDDFKFSRHITFVCL